MKEQIAFHEAGHCLAYLRSGAKFESVTIKADLNSEGGVKKAHIKENGYERLRISIMAAYAGHAADEVYLGRKFRITDSVQSAYDLRVINMELENFNDDVEAHLFAKWAKHKIEKIINSQTGTRILEKIADALLRLETLSYEQVLEIYNAVYDEIESGDA